MSRRWKQIISLLLLILFMFNSSVYGVSLSVRLYLHQLAEKNALKKPSEEIMELRIGENLVEHRNNEFEWEKEWEFCYHGEMYDVVSSHKEGTTWVFQCKHDTKEEILKNRAKREAKRNQQERETQCKKNVKVGSDYLPCTSGIISGSSFTCDLCTAPASLCDEVVRGVPSPPPWC